MKKRNWIFLSVTLALILGLSMYLYSTYDEIEISKIENINRSSYDMGAFIMDSTYAIDKKMQGEDVSVFKRYIDKEDQEVYTQEVIEYLENSSIKFKNAQENLKYYAVNTQTNEVISNNENLLEELNKKDKDDKYRYYVTLSFDGNGKMSIDTFGHNSWKEAFPLSYEEKGLAEYGHYGYWDNYHFSDDFVTQLGVLKNPRNLTVTYAINKELTTNENEYIFHNMYERHSSYIESIFPYLLVAMAVIVLFILCYPIRIMKEIPFLNKLANIKLGILGIGMGFAYVGISVLASFMLRGTIGNYIHAMLKEMNLLFLEGILNILVWSILFVLIAFTVFMIKFILNKGILRYLRENTVICWLWDKFKCAIDKVTSIDFNEQGNKVILKIVGLNFIIITVISFFFMFGFIAAFVYSVVLFIILRKKYDQIQNDYRKLLKAIKQLSEGDFDVNVEEDMGMFNPLKEEFSGVKQGFEKAVQEEVKSQRMKTELISNVSHDLKTPLTSIITYVDLLKQENISDDERKQYVDTIDRNSQRLKNLIDDLFEVSKANSGDVKLNLIDVDIVSLIKQAQFECLDKIEEMGLDFRCNFSSDKIIHKLDSSKTYRIFENLIMNICKYAMPNTRVYVDVIENEETIDIIFKNISNYELSASEEELMERFVQGDKSRNTNGSGLGLSIVKSFTKLQNGEFNICIDGDLFKATVIFSK